MKTSDRVDKLAVMPVNQTPEKARQLAIFLSKKYGFCGDLLMSAYEAYAIVIENTEGGHCDEESRRFLKSLDQLT